MLSQTPAQQIEAIHAMLAAGHRNLRMEKHSFWLWGIAAGVLFAISDLIFTPEQIPSVEQRAMSWLVLLALVLGGVGIADWWLTRRVKAARDEVWSFIHRQIIKIWWLLVAIGILLTFAMFFFGGGYMVCAAWIVLIGLGLFIHGLFSDQLLELAGGAMLLIGVLSLAFHLSYEEMKWVATATFGLGMPALSIMLNRPQPQRLCLSLLVLVLPLSAYHRFAVAAPNAPIASLETFRHQAGTPATQIVALDKGTTIPVHIQLSGNLFQQDADLVLPLRLAQPMEIVMQAGKPTRQVRISGQEWSAKNDAGWVQIPWIHTTLTPQTGPKFDAALVVNLHQP